MSRAAREPIAPQPRHPSMRRLLLPVLVLSLSALPACAEGPAQSPAPTSAAPVWERLPDLPLTERDGPVVVWTGAEVLAVGGNVGPACPPGADCVTPTSAVDGAALDVATGTWRRIADAPRPIPPYSQRALVGDLLFVKADPALLAYDLVEDRWQEVQARVNAWYDLVADGDRLVLVSGSDEQGVRRDLAYEPSTGAWSRLPDDPLGPSFDRRIVSTSRGLLLQAHDLVDSPGAGAHPSYIEAALLDRGTGTWRTFGPSDQLGTTWSVVGDRAVALSLGGSDGGGDDPDGDYGRWIPSGGRLDLVTGTWSRLPRAPKEGSGGWPVEAPGSRLIAGEGYVYDDAGETWLRIPPPSGGPDAPGPAVWVDESLVVVTGHRQGDPGERSNQVWAWGPLP